VVVRVQRWQITRRSGVAFADRATARGWRWRSPLGSRAAGWLWRGRAVWRGGRRAAGGTGWVGTGTGGGGGGWCGWPGGGDGRGVPGYRQDESGVATGVGTGAGRLDLPDRVGLRAGRRRVPGRGRSAVRRCPAGRAGLAAGRHQPVAARGWPAAAGERPV